MNQETDPTPPMLMLPDKCLLEILQHLEFTDFVHFAQTCVRLRNVARLNKFKRILVHTMPGVTNHEISRREFVNTMSLIGEHVVHVHIHCGFNDLFEIIRDNCKNLNFLASFDCVEPVQIRGFKNVKELKLSGKYAKEVLPDFNNDIVSLDVSELNYSGSYFSKLLKRLPNLKSLHLGYVSNDIYCLHSQEFPINGLTSFFFRSTYNLNRFLMKISSLNLVELCFEMDFNEATFDILQRFQNLEVLVMLHHCEVIMLPEATVLPPKLKYVKIDYIDISWSKFSSIVKESECLEVFDLGSNGCILFNESGSEHFPSKRAGRENIGWINVIEKNLGNRRPLTIMYSHFALSRQAYVHRSNNLQVVNNWIANEQKPKEKIAQVYLKL